MAFIYKIVNDINNKVYIGKTEESVEKRFKEHCQARCQSQVNSRPLYSAMNKYGVNHFRVEQIEETDSPEEREQYWIKEYDSYGSSGYNATKGGDGARYADYDLIFSLWNQGFSNKEICQKLNYDTATVRAALQNFGVSKAERQERGRIKLSKKILMIDKDTDKVLKTFLSITDALSFLNKGNGGHISQVCQGKRKTAYGYKWKYLDEN